MNRRLILVIAAFLGGLVAGLLIMREPMEPLSSDLLGAARQRWRAADVSDYAIRYQLHQDVYDVNVEGGIVTEITVNGERPRSADLQNYTVEGLFEVLALEIENLQDPRGPFAAQKGTVMARVRFNKRFGYVERYIRNSAGMGRGASIETLSFEPVAAP